MEGAPFFDDLGGKGCGLFAPSAKAEIDDDYKFWVFKGDGVLWGGKRDASKPDVVIDVGFVVWVYGKRVHNFCGAGFTDQLIA